MGPASPLPRQRRSADVMQDCARNCPQRIQTQEEPRGPSFWGPPGVSLRVSGVGSMAPATRPVLLRAPGVAGSIAVIHPTSSPNATPPYVNPNPCPPGLAIPLSSHSNALLSTGPRTPEGKAIASMNASKHGLLSIGRSFGE